MYKKIILFLLFFLFLCSGCFKINTKYIKINLECSASTVEDIYLEGKLYKKGDRGEKVKRIQELINKLGYNIDTDGIFGRQTKKAVIAFQKKTHILVDGIVGPITMKKLRIEIEELTKEVNVESEEVGVESEEVGVESEEVGVESEEEDVESEEVGVESEEVGVESEEDVESEEADLKSQKENKCYLNKNITSLTNYIICVDLQNHKVNIFKSHDDNWELEKEYLCSTGKTSTPTVKGIFKIGTKGSYFRVNKNCICKYYSQFYGNYLFHTVLLDNKGNILDGTLGKSVSHGCVRLPIEAAKYIYDNIPKGTTVIID